MNHRQILDATLATLPGSRSRYFNQVADAVDRDPRFADRHHLLYPVLAGAAPQLEALLPPLDLAELLNGFLDRQGGAIAAALYSRAYIQSPTATLRPLITHLAADVAMAIFAALDSGRIQPPAESRRYHFTSDQAHIDFPYDD